MRPRLSPFALTVVVAMALLAGCKDKQDATRQKRLATLIDDSANNRRIAQLQRPGS